MNPEKSNVSLNEIEKFNEFAQDWWDENGRMKSLHDINPLRLDYIMRQADLKGKNVLDVGCGGGILTEKIAIQGAFVTGIDASPDMISIATRHAKASDLDIRYINTDIENITGYTKNKFDMVLCMELLEHVPDYGSVIQACKNVLNPDGIIIFATINRNILSFLLAIICAEYVLKLLPKGTHEYRSLITPLELNHSCSEAGLKNVDTIGFTYNPFSRKYYFCKNTLVNYLSSYRPI